MTPEEYALLQSIAKNISQNAHLTDDLIQEVAIYWLELAEDKKSNIREKGMVKAWFIRTIMNQDRSKTSYFYRRYKTQPMMDSKDLEDIFDREFEEDERDHHLDLIQDWVEELFMSDRNIVKDYYYKGMTILGIAAKYDIDKNNVVSVLNRVKNSFYRRIIWRGIPRRNLEIGLAEIIAPLVGRSRLKVEERQLIIDAHNFLYGTKHEAFFDKELCTLLLKSLIQKLYL